MRIGLQLPEVERDYRWQEIRQIAITAEEVGFDSIWVGDHLLFKDPITGHRGPWEAWSMLAALAAVTTRVSLGPLVASTSFHSPAMLAKKAATVDEISGGRLILGLGAGWHRPEYEAYGFQYDHRVSRFGEAFTVIRTLLREGYIDFEGRYYTIRDCELLPQPRADIPLMVGSTGPRMLRITAPHVDLWNTWFVWFDNRPDGLQPMFQLIEEACADVGRDPREIERTAAVYVQLPGGAGRVAGSENRPKARPITGGDTEIAGSLAEFADAGLDRLQVVLDPLTATSVEHMGRILREVRKYGSQS